MIFVSITRLRLRSLRFLPAFALRSWRSTRQIRRSPGFIAGGFATEGVRGFWTITAWSEDAAMRDYRNGGDHGRAMSKLSGWCDEASLVHWLQEGEILPSPAEALRRMVEGGRLSKVRHPSAGHAAGLIAPDRLVPRTGPSLRPLRLQPTAQSR